MQQKSTNSEHTKKPDVSGKISNMSRVTTAIVGVVVLAGLVAAYHAFAASKPAINAGSVTGTASLSLSPSASSASVGKNFSVSVWENSQTDQVNAVQANLTYSTSQFSYVGLDASGSAFSVAAEGTNSNGVVKIARGSITNRTGNQLVAKVILKPKVSSGKAAVNFTTGSAIIRVSDYKDILQKSSGGTYTLKK